MSASCWVTATRATAAVFSSDDRPTAQTTPIAIAVPSDASASRADRAVVRKFAWRMHHVAFLSSSIGDPCDEYYAAIRGRCRFAS